MSAAAASLLKDASLLKTKSYVNGEWVEAKSGKQFTVDSKLKKNSKDKKNHCHSTLMKFSSNA